VPPSTRGRGKRNGQTLQGETHHQKPVTSHSKTRCAAPVSKGKKEGRVNEEGREIGGRFEEEEGTAKEEPSPEKGGNRTESQLVVLPASDPEIIGATEEDRQRLSYNAGITQICARRIILSEGALYSIHGHQRETNPWPRKEKIGKFRLRT